MFTTTLEAILFAIGKPISKVQLLKQFGIHEDVLKESIRDIESRFNTPFCGIHLQQHDGYLQFVSNPDCGLQVAQFLKKESSGPLSKSSLETLTVIAYKGPLTQSELESIRGVNCSIILRSLLIRGLITSKMNDQKLAEEYLVSLEFLQKLGLKNIEELPEYQEFQQSESLNQLMQKQEEI